MRINVLAACRRPPAWVSEQTAAYAKRLPRNFELSFNFIAPGADQLSSAERKRDEAHRFKKKRAAESIMIALDETGKTLSSPALAKTIGHYRNNHQDLCVLIGGADGLDQSLLTAAQECWSMSALTLPHLLAQVLIAEQIYRAWSILENHPYHRS